MYRLIFVGLLWGLQTRCWAPVLSSDIYRGSTLPARTLSLPPEEPSPEFPAVTDTYQGIPGWVMRGVLFRETKSHYKADGSIVYVDRRRGLAGEVGAFQTMPSVVEAFSDYTPSQVHRDTRKAEEVAAAYLKWIFKGPAKGNWHRAARMYNVGPSGNIHGPRALAYLATVIRVGPSVPQR